MCHGIPAIGASEPLSLLLPLRATTRDGRLAHTLKVTASRNGGSLSGLSTAESQRLLWNLPNVRNRV
jgi:hypothetical protein